MSQYYSRTSFAFLMTVLPGIPFLPIAAQAAPPPASYIPATTTVAILPVENISNGRDENMKAKQTERGTRGVSEAFAQRGFKLADPLTVSKAIQDSHLDLSSSASWTSENLANLGLRSAADLVVLLVITDTHQGFRHGFLIMGAQREGEAKTKLWLVSSRTRSAVIDGQGAAGKSQASALAGWATGGYGEGSSAYTLRAVDDAVNKSLSDFLKPYPKQGDRSAKSMPLASGSPLPMPSTAVLSAAPTKTVASTVHTPAPVPVSAPPQSQFTFLNGSQATGNLISFDGSTYTVSTPKGMRRFRAAGIKSIFALPDAAVAAAISK